MFGPALPRRGYALGAADTRRRLLRVAIVVALVAGVAVGPAVLGRLIDHATPSKAEVTQRMIRAYVARAYPAWRAAQSPALGMAKRSVCPRDLAELEPFVTFGTRDAWGTPFVMHCATHADVAMLIVRSAGEDCVLGTADDQWSDR